MKHYKFMSEEVLAKQIVLWLKNLGWEVYQEVQFSSSGHIADIVAKKENKLWVIETKLNSSFQVFAQADGWIGLASQVSIGVPMASLSVFKQKIARLLGLGIITVEGFSWKEDFIVDEKIKAPENKNPLKSLFDQLKEEQKTFAKAGNNLGSRYTPYIHTLKLLTEYTKNHQGESFRKSIKNIKHHYASDNSAYTSLSHWIFSGSVKTLRLDYDKKGKLVIFSV